MCPAGNSSRAANPQESSSKNEALTLGGPPEIEKERGFTQCLGAFTQNRPGHADFSGYYCEETIFDSRNADCTMV